MARAKLVDGKVLRFHCPGCKVEHGIPVRSAGANNWDWNGSLDAPVTNPSILVTMTLYGPNKEQFEHYRGPMPCEATKAVCHCYLEGENIRFCSDCTAHELGGQTVPLPALAS